MRDFIEVLQWHCGIMTLLASFSANNVHYIVADAAITTRGALRREGPRRSSFGEKHRATRRGFVREEALKLYRLGIGVIGAYCGSVRFGIPALDHIKRRLAIGERFVEAVESVQPLVATAELLLVGPDRFNTWRRWFVSDASIVEDYDNTVVRVAGSATDQQRTFVDNAYEAFLAIPEIKANPYHALTAAIVGVQAHGQRVDLVDQGIGGTFWGLGASESGILAQRDIMYMLFDADEGAEARIRIETLSAVVSGQREHIAFAWRARLRQRGLRVFVGDVSFVSDEDIRRSAPGMMDVQPYYLAFVERRTGSVLVCGRETLDDDALFALRYHNRELKMTLSASVIQHLSAFPAVRANDELPREVPFGFIMNRPSS